jgi:hypothetical protein
MRSPIFSICFLQKRIFSISSSVFDLMVAHMPLPTRDSGQYVTASLQHE